MNLHRSSHTLRFGAPLAKARGAVILVHGRGASAQDIASLAQALPHEGIAFFAPDAQQGTWYPQRFFVPLEQNEPWLSSGIALLQKLVEEIHAAGVPYDRIGLAGFSQGGCLVLEHAVRHPQSYGFVAGMSSALIGPMDTPRPSSDLTGVPVLVACAAADPHIPLPFVEEAARIFPKLGAALTKQIFPGNDHTVFAEEVAWLSDKIESWH